MRDTICNILFCSLFVRDWSSQQLLSVIFCLKYRIMCWSIILSGQMRQQFFLLGQSSVDPRQLRWIEFIRRHERWWKWYSSLSVFNEMWAHSAGWCDFDVDELSSTPASIDFYLDWAFFFFWRLPVGTCRLDLEFSLRGRWRAPRVWPIKSYRLHWFETHSLKRAELYREHRRNCVEFKEAGQILLSLILAQKSIWL